MEIVNTGLDTPVTNESNSLKEASSAVGQGSSAPAQLKESNADRQFRDEYPEIANELKELSDSNEALSNKIDKMEGKEGDRQSFFSADKSFSKDSSALKAWKKIDGIASSVAEISNVVGGFMQLMNLPETAKSAIAKFVDLVTNFSFIPYGLDGMRKAFFENKNPYMLLGFAMELSMVWMSDLKNKYLIRGAATGTDQIWVATQHKLMAKDAERFKNGKFQSWTDGLIETPKACIEMVKDIFTNPVKALATIDKEKGTGGYYALLSSLGSFMSTVGYFLTRNEKVFGTMRDISGTLFDWEMLLDKKPIAKLSGLCFIAESVLDFTARFIGDNSTRLFVNMLSHASGRRALQLYKASNEDAQDGEKETNKPIQDKQPLKSHFNPLKKLHNENLQALAA